MGIIPGVGLCSYGGYYFEGDHPFNLGTYLRKHPQRASLVLKDVHYVVKARFDLTGRAAPGDRTAGSVAAALLAVQRGAAVVRVHDVRGTVDALRVLAAVELEAPGG